MTYTYARGTDGCDNTFDILTPEGEYFTAIHFWDRVEGAEQEAKLIVDALNAFRAKLSEAAKLVIERWQTGDLSEAVRQLDEAVKAAA